MPVTYQLAETFDREALYISGAACDRALAILADIEDEPGLAQGLDKGIQSDHPVLHGAIENLSDCFELTGNNADSFREGFRLTYLAIYLTAQEHDQAMPPLDARFAENFIRGLILGKYDMIQYAEDALDTFDEEDSQLIDLWHRPYSSQTAMMSAFNHQCFVLGGLMTNDILLAQSHLNNELTSYSNCSDQRPIYPKT